MKKIAKFEKVSYNQFKNDFMDSFPQYNEKEVEEIYHSIQLPKRATKGSAGYDFYSPIDFELNPGQTIKIPTGIRVRIENGWVLGLYPRSGLGFKYRLQLNNTVGIIDSDYTGELCLIIDNTADYPCRLFHGERVAQLLIKKNEDVAFKVVKELKDTKRGSGGIGSTGK